MRTRLTLIASLLTVCVVLSFAQDKMTKDQWQAEMNRLTALRTELAAKLKTSTDRLTSLQAESAKLDADVPKCMDELYGLVGSNAEAAAAYRAEIDAAEAKAADLMTSSGSVDELDAKVKSLWENKLSLIPEFWDRLTALNDRIKSLKNTLAGAGKTYTVGTWAKDRDCLWNISKKKDIYDNAWMWPKIWQGNRDQIKDPDVIEPGQKLKIPSAGAMTSEEKAAAKSYYGKKSAK